jgi:putative copper export protein
MDTLMLTLRLLHVFFGTFWAGTVIFSTLYLEPQLKRLGPGIQNPLMKALMPAITPAMMVSSVTVLLTGIAMTLLLRGSALNLLLSTAWGWAMLVGFVATLAAIVIGFGVMAPSGMQIEKLAKSFEGRAPTPDEARTLAGLNARIESLSRVDFVLILLAVGAMAAARYL